MFFPKVVRPIERDRFTFFLCLSSLLSFGLTLGLVATESLILSVWGAATLPLSFVLSSTVTVVGSLFYALGVDQAKNDRYFIWLLIFFASAILGLAYLAPQHNWAYLGLGSVYFLSFAVLNNHYWTFTGDFFDTLAAKRLFPLFLVGNSLGGFLAGLVVSSGVSAQKLLPCWALTLVVSAVFIRFFRRDLRRWGPLELEESDETSLDGMRNALLYIRQSLLGKCMALACVTLIVSLFFAQFLYSQIISASFPNPDDLTLFLGRLLTVTNLLEVFIEAILTPILITRLGVASANLIHPTLTFISFLFLLWNPQLICAVVARLNRETLDNALGGPIRNLVYNALPDRFRGRLRALLEGIVVYSGMALAGGFLMLASVRLSTTSLTICGLICSLGYLGAHVMVRRAYLGSLLSELRAGRLELSDLGGELASFEIERLGKIWEALTHEASLSPTNPNPVAQRFVYTLAARGVYQPLYLACQTDHPIWLRRTCIEALQSRLLSQPALVAKLLGDSSSVVLSATLTILVRFNNPSNGLLPIAPETLKQSLEQLKKHSDWTVKSLACVLCWTLLKDEQAHLDLRSQAAQAEESIAASALALIGVEDLDLLRQRCCDPSFVLRRISYTRLAELWSGQSVLSNEGALLRQGLADSEAQVRIAVLKLLEATQWLPVPIDLKIEQEFELVIGSCFTLFDDPYPEVRERVASFLSGLGDEILEVHQGKWPRRKLKSQAQVSTNSDLAKCLDSDQPHVLETALRLLALRGSGNSRSLLTQQFRKRVQKVWYLHLAHQILLKREPFLEETLQQFLCSTLLDFGRRELQLAFQVLSHLEDPKIMGSVEKVLRFASVKARADALEVLSNLGDRESAKLLVLLLEDENWAERSEHLPAQLERPNSVADIISWVRNSQNPWMKLVIGHLETDLPPTNSAILRLRTRQTKELFLMERLLVLRKVPLFAHMSLDQLDAINRLLKEMQYLRGEVLFKEGELGDELYILVEGDVRITKGLGTPEEKELNRMSGVSYFGEMSILDDEPRSASVVAETDCSLLVLRGEQLKILIHQIPEIAFEIFKVLTLRIRQTVSGAVVQKSGSQKT